MSKVEDEEGPRSFIHFLDELGGGDAARELSEELHELGRKMLAETLTRERKCTGELTLKIKLKAEKNGLVGTTYEIKRKDPSRSTTPGVAWLTASGNLSSENPRQADLPGLRELPGGRATPRDVDDNRAQRAPKEV